MLFLPTIKNASVRQDAQSPLLNARDFSPILTKLTPPCSSKIRVQRRRLLLRLDNATASSLTLVCASAGSGKTTLLAQWYHHRQRQGDAQAWLSLDEADSTPVQFMRYLLEAIRPLYQCWSQAFERYFEGELPADISQFMAELINQIYLYPQPLYLILDDYQNIQHQKIHDGLMALLHHAPSSLHLIIASRYRPPLALSVMQVQDRLVEIYDEELRFNAAEATAYIMATATSSLKKHDIQRIVAITEGWAAGMKMVMLSTRDKTGNYPVVDNPTAHLSSIKRYVEEVVLAPLPPDIVDFLTKTSMLNRLHSGLCDAVTGQKNGEQVLAWLVEHNVLVTSLDAGGFWFRYHPLLRDALLNRLQHSPDIDIRTLHERAGHWLVAQQQWAEAIRHALASEKIGTQHADAGAQSLAEEGDIGTMVRSIGYLPANLNPSQIELQLNLAWALAHHFRFNDARQLLNAIEEMMVGRSVAVPRSSWIKLRVVRAICEAFAGNISLSLCLVEPLLQTIPCGDIWVDGLIGNILSYCHLATSRPQQALDIQHSLSGYHRNLFVEVYRAFVVAQGYLRQGNLVESEREALQALHHAQQCTGANSSSSATLAPVLAEIAWEQGHVERVDELLRLRLPMIDDFCPPDGLSACYILLAKQAQLNGETEEAEALLLHTEQLAIQRGWLRVRLSVMAERLNLRLQSGETEEAARMLHQLKGLAHQAATEQHHGLSWYVYLSQSRLLLAHDQPHAAADLLHTQVLEQEKCGEWLSAVRSRLLQAVALWRAGATERAVACSKPALQRAIKQKLLRSLLDAGPDLLKLVNHSSATQVPDDGLSNALRQLWAAPFAVNIGEPCEVKPSDLRLTEREQQTLHLIADGYSNKSIARSLGISVETVKWHLKQLYRKLQANGRIQALNQARIWHLLS